MHRIVFGLCLTAALAIGSTANASIVFNTKSVATQTITSPLFGSSPVVISATGTQHFTVDLIAGLANVTSDLKGSDLPNPLSPGSFLTYDLYNVPAGTTGTASLNGGGTYDVVFSLLFELKITSGPLAGQTFETMQFATFAASNIAALPFPVGTVFQDPNPADTVVIFAKTALPGKYAAGDPIGTSSGRTVTIIGAVPEPSTVVSLAAGVVCLVIQGVRRRRVNRG